MTKGVHFLRNVHDLICIDLTVEWKYALLCLHYIFLDEYPGACSKRISKGESIYIIKIKLFVVFTFGVELSVDNRNS